MTYKFLYCVMDISFVFVTFVANSKHLWHYVVLYGLISVSYTGISIPCDLILYYVYAQIFWILIFVKPVANTNVHSQEICFSMFDFGECGFIIFSICWISTGIWRKFKQKIWGFNVSKICKQLYEFCMIIARSSETV